MNISHAEYYEHVRVADVLDRDVWTNLTQLANPYSLLPMTMNATKERLSMGYVLGAYTTVGRYVLVDGFRTYEEALAAFAAALAEIDNFPETKHYAIRSAEDPDWQKHAKNPDHYVNRNKVVSAARAAVRKEIGATALTFLKQAEPNTSLFKIERLVMESLKARGYTPERFEVEDAVKARVLLGRCRHCNGKPGYWLLKKEGPLQKALCPNGHQMNQSSLALGAGFYRLDTRVAVS